MLGQLHEKFMQNTPGYLKSAGAYKEASIMEDNMSLLMTADKSPDNDYPNYKIPTSLLPDSMPAELKSLATGTSIIKWEHVYPLDMPKELSDLIKNISEQYLKIPFRYADVALQDWFAKAVSLWTTSRGDSLWHIGRCCHLVQDISTPVHIAVSGNFRDVYDVFTHASPNHERFEQYCLNIFKAPEVIYQLEPINTSTIIKEIALKSKEYLKYCDGINMPNWSKKILPGWLFRLLGAIVNDDYDKAALYANESAQKYTILLMHQFFQTVTVI